MRLLRSDLPWHAIEQHGVASGRAAFLLLLLALSLRLFRLGDQSLWIDELLTIWQGRVEGYSLWRQFLDDAQNPLPMLVVAWMGRWHDSEFWLRLPSALWGAASVLILLRIGRRLGGDRVGVFAALLLAVHPLHILHSQEVRGYAALVFFGLAAIELALGAAARPSFWRMLSVVICGCAAVLSNLSGLFWMGGLALGGLWSRRWNRANAWHWSTVFALILLVSSHWWLLGASVHESERLVPGTSTGEELRSGTTFSGWSIPYAALALSFGAELGPSDAQLRSLSDGGSAWALLLPQLWALSLAAFCSLMLCLAGLPSLRERRQEWWVWALVPLVAAVVLALRNVKPFNPRYVLVALPSLLLLWAFGLDRLRRSLALPLLLASLALNAVALQRHWFEPNYQREDVRAAVREIEQREGDEDVILAPGVNRVVEYYYLGNSPIENLSPAQLASEAEIAAALAQLQPDLRYVWHLRARPWATDPQARLSRALASRYRSVARLRLPGVDVQLYDRSSAPDSTASD